MSAVLIGFCYDYPHCQLVPGSIPSLGPRHIRDVLKMVPVSAQHLKGNTSSFSRIRIRQKVMDKIWDGNPLKSDVIGHCGRYGTNN